MCGLKIFLDTAECGMSEEALLREFASWLAAAKLLKRREAALRGTVLLIFQPAEEGGAGRFHALQPQDPAL